jgi:hypothetical protein
MADTPRESATFRPKGTSDVTFLSKVVKQTQLYVTLRRVSNSQELAKIDPDTGLQDIVGPSLNKALAVSLQRNFSHGAVYVSYSQADARDIQTGEPVSEAPRMIVNFRSTCAAQFSGLAASATSRRTRR